MRLKQLATVGLCFICVGFYLFAKNETVPVFLEKGHDTASSVQIFRLNKEGLLIPVQMGVEEENDSIVLMKQAMQMMALELPYFEYEAILPEKTQLLDVKVNDGHAVLNFNSELLNYPKEKELRMVEALVWSATQFEGIDSVSFLVENEVLNQLPYGTPLFQSMSRRFGMNNLSLQDTFLHDTIPLNLYVQKDKTAYIQTFRVQEKPDLQATLNQMAALISEASQYSDLVHVIDVKVSDNVLVLTMKDNILSEERVARSELIEPLLLSIHDTFGYEFFQILVNDEIVNLSGSHENIIAASSLQVHQILL